MGRVHEVLRWANRREVAREVTARGYRVSGETLNRWVRDEQEFPAVVERIVFELFTIGAHEKTAPDVPERLERIERLVTAIAAATPGVALEEVEQVAAELGPLLQTHGESRQQEGPGIRDESRA